MDKTVSMFVLVVTAFVLYLFLKRNPQLLENANATIEDIKKDSTYVIGKPISKWTRGPAFLMTNNPWVFAPAIGNILARPTGTDPNKRASDPVIIGVPR